MKTHSTELEGVLIIEPCIIGEERGYFYQSYSQKNFEQQVLKTSFIQDKQSYSCRVVLRGQHYQSPPHARSKLVRVIKGRVLDIAADIRKGSPSYGKNIAPPSLKDLKSPFTYGEKLYA